MQDQLPKGMTFVVEEDGVKEYKLANGMKLLLIENRVAPVATMMVLYKVGSRNEAVGYTGSTHILEHMLFKGTPTFNKNSNTQIAATLQRIGADFNATTWYDRTNYFETVPSDQLELAIKLEADRMRNSFIDDGDRQSEMTVVRNELERGQNEPSEVLDEAVYSAAFREHPYHHPTIGWRADVEGVPTSRLKAFYDTFYYPNNATAIVVGDFELDNVLELINKYFGAYEGSPHPIPQIYTDEPEQQGERRLIVRRAGELALVQIAFHTPAALGQSNVLSTEELSARSLNPPAGNDIYPLVVLSAAMSNGVTSRLYQALVETELAVAVNSNADQHRDPGLFNFYATAHPGVEPAQIEEVILKELKRVSDEGLSAAEVAKSKKQIIAEESFARDGTFNIAVQMSEAEAVADWRFFKDYAKNVEKVTVEDVQRVARAYFHEDNRTVGHFIPKRSNNGGGGSENGNGSGPSKVSPESALQSNTSGRGSFPRGVKFHHDPDVVEDSLVREPSSDNETFGGGNGSSAFVKEASRPNSSTKTPQLGIASRVKRTTLDNGAVLLTLANTANPTVSIRGSFRAGSYFEPRDRPGLADITASMLSRGTEKRSKLELAHDLESVGADLDFSSDAFAVNIVGRSLKTDLRLVLDALAEELRQPAFPLEELEKLKMQTAAIIQEQQSSTGYRAFERFSSLIFDESNPFYIPSGDRLIASVNAITVDDVRRFYEERFGGRSLILSIAGDVNTNDVRNQFEEAFGSFSGPANIEIEVVDPEPQPGPCRETVIIKEKANVDILLGSAASLRRSSEDYYAAIIANSALGQSTLSSRLGLQVRDREGLTYGINSAFRAPSLAAGPWYIGVSVNPNNVEQAIESALKVLREYVENGIHPDELANEKSSAIGSFKVSLATNRGLARAVWNSEYHGLGLEHMDRFAEIVGAVSLEQVNEAIRKYFRPDSLTIVISGDYLNGSAASPVR